MMAHSNELTTREKIQYSLIGIIVVGGAAIIATRLLKKGVANQEERKTMEDGSAATYAKQLKMAFENDGWPGTDEDAIRETLRRIPTKEVFNEVILSYHRLYNENLLRDMKDELTASEYNEMLAIISMKPDRITGGATTITPAHYIAWARRLKAAFDLSYGWFPATDEEAVKAVFIEIPTQAAFRAVVDAYRAEYARDLNYDLQHELEFWEFDEFMKIITDKPAI